MKMKNEIENLAVENKSLIDKSKGVKEVMSSWQAADGTGDSYLRVA